MQSDYLDAENLQVLIDSGFSIGFHGHQHKPQFIEERLQFGVNRKITIISAGTLCAGPGQLPTGHTRAYNLLEIDTEQLTAKLHVRQMSPVWGPGRLSSTMQSFADFEIQRPTQRSSSLATNVIGEAESLLRNKKPQEAASLLRPLASESLLARRLLLECYVECDDTKAIVECFYPPTATNEVVYVADALWVEQQYNLLRELVMSDLVRNSSEPAVDEVRRKYKERLRQ
jgi:hypothetical protein